MKLYVGNLSYEMTADDLATAISSIAPGCTVEVLIDPMCGRSRGFGFITTPDDRIGTLLVERLNGQPLEGRLLAVNEARPLEERPHRHRLGPEPRMAPPRPAELEVAKTEPLADMEPPGIILAHAQILERGLLEWFAANPAEMKRMPRRDFEKLVLEIWRRLGYEVELQKQTRDGGIDIIATRHAEAAVRFLIQCKRPNAGNKVSVEAVRTLLGVKLDRGGSKAILATTETFTPDARAFLNKHLWDLEGRDYDGLLEWLVLVQHRRAW